MLKRKVKFVILILVFLCVVQRSNQCRPAPDWKPMSVEERVQRAPVVVRGYLVKKIGNINSFKACLYVNYVYKGHLSSNYICADNFGSTAACLSDLNFGVEYLFFLNRKRLGGFFARYDDIHSAAVPFTKKISTDIKNGLCCPKKLGSKYFSARIRFSSSVFLWNQNFLSSLQSLLYKFPFQ